ncbi:hypothetical protein ACFVRR_24090 [Gottfriedia sp. NPDC057948]|uniref:hypothetical protein n=1 Tax=Gottfriedia sp. NPDC057948 TaxID=3346287 RepID=UPI0036DEBFA9
MGRIKIEKLIYEGDQYYYESPEFKDGINIIEGENGSGKSTLSNLISFSLGNYVKEFDKRESKVHKEIVNDTNNFVLIKISISGEKYKIKRFFESNRIFIEDKENIQDFLIYRPQSDVKVFSDWLLEKLDIPVVEFFQGTSQSKLNFSDLFRLIYYDQRTVPEKIYKDSRNDGNFISDSEFMRKVIFQMLMGHEFSEYYYLIGELNKSKKEKSKLKAREEGFIELANEFGFGKLHEETLDEIKNSIDKKLLQLQRLEINEEELLRSDKKPPENIEKIRQLKKNLVDIELFIEDKLNKINRLFREIKNIKDIRENIILEVIHIKKIILTHEELNLFSPDTCPYCLSKVERKEGHCICGKEVEESEFEKFFYSTDEYLTILKSKQKSVETLDLAIQSCNDDLNMLEKELEDYQKKKVSTQKLINEGKEDIERNTNVIQIKDIQQQKFNIKENIISLEQYYKVKQNFEKIKKQLTIIDNTLSGINVDLKQRERNAKDEINMQVTKFSDIYNSLLVDIKHGINRARIDEDKYMPVINDGEYKEASVDVPIRLMYFLTLLKMSIEDIQIPFPRFLLIDTPESLGIDPENLEKSMSKFTTIMGEKETDNFQIILTSGIKKYPEEFSSFKRGRSLYKSEKLLLEKK